MLIVSEVRKSTSFSSEKPFAVVRFRKGAKGSKFAVGSLNDGNSYSLTYNLSLIYPECKNEEGGFDVKEAYKRFKNEMTIGMEENVNGYDVNVSDISDYKSVFVKATKREMFTLHPACYGSKEDAIRIAKASLDRQLRQKTVVPTLSESDGDDEDDE